MVCVHARKPQDSWAEWSDEPPGTRGQFVGTLGGACDRTELRPTFVGAHVFGHAVRQFAGSECGRTRRHNLQRTSTASSGRVPASRVLRRALESSSVRSQARRQHARRFERLERTPGSQEQLQQRRRAHLVFWRTRRRGATGPTASRPIQSHMEKTFAHVTVYAGPRVVNVVNS